MTILGRIDRVLLHDAQNSYLRCSFARTSGESSGTSLSKALKGNTEGPRTTGEKDYDELDLGEHEFGLPVRPGPKLDLAIWVSLINLVFLVHCWS